MSVVSDAYQMLAWAGGRDPAAVPAFLRQNHPTRAMHSAAAAGDAAAAAAGAAQQPAAAPGEDGGEGSSVGEGSVADRDNPQLASAPGSASHSRHSSADLGGFRAEGEPPPTAARRSPPEQAPGGGDSGAGATASQRPGPRSKPPGRWPEKVVVKLVTKAKPRQ